MKKPHFTARIKLLAILMCINTRIASIKGIISTISVHECHKPQHQHHCRKSFLFAPLAACGFAGHHASGRVLRNSRERNKFIQAQYLQTQDVYSREWCFKQVNYREWRPFPSVAQSRSSASLLSIASLRTIKELKFNGNGESVEWRMIEKQAKSC
jgi:hypothetical protein